MNMVEQRCQLSPRMSEAASALENAILNGVSLAGVKAVLVAISIRSTNRSSRAVPDLRQWKRRTSAVRSVRAVVSPLFELPVCSTQHGRVVRTGTVMRVKNGCR